MGHDAIIMCSRKNDMTTESKLQWQDPEWQKHAHDWIRTQAERNSIRITGEIEQPHTYHWSTVMSIPTNEGMLFFKATAGETIYEIPLTKKLAGWFPDDMPELVAVDTARGWMLMRDGGEQLRADSAGLVGSGQHKRQWTGAFRHLRQHR